MRTPSRPASAATLLLALLWGAAPASEGATSEDVTARARVDATRVGTQDRLTLTVEVRARRLGEVTPPELDAVEAFTVVQGPVRSRSTERLRSATVQREELTWTLVPRGVGRTRIPPLSVAVDGRRVRTREIVVEVVQGSVAGQSPSRADASGFPFGRREPTPAREPAVRVVATVDRATVYVGQQLTFSCRIVTDTPLTGVDLLDEPPFAGFWVEPIAIPADGAPRTVVERGERLTRYTVLRRALFPTLSGEVVIDPVELGIGVRGNDPDSLVGREATTFRETEPVAVTVLPLPSADRPASFTGAVGRFALDVALDRDETELDAAVALTVRVEGTGNLHAIAPPELPEMDGFRAFAPVEDRDFGLRDGRLAGSRSWRYVLVPRAAGELRVGPVELSFFDPETASYRRLRSEALALVVHAGSPAAETPAASPQGDAARTRPHDLHAIATNVERLRRDGARSAALAAWIAALVGAPLATLALAGYRRRAARRAAAADALRRERAQRRARRRLRAAATIDPEGDVAAAGARVQETLTRYVADRFCRPPWGLTRARMAAFLTAAGASAAACEALFACLDACEAVRYAPVASGEATGDLVQRGLAVVDRLETELRAEPGRTASGEGAR